MVCLKVFNTFQCNMYQPAHFPSLDALTKFPLPRIHTRIPLNRKQRAHNNSQATVTAPIQYNGSLNSSCIDPMMTESVSFCSSNTYFMPNDFKYLSTVSCGAARCQVVTVDGFKNFRFRNGDVARLFVSDWIWYLLVKISSSSGYAHSLMRWRHRVQNQK